MVKRRLPRMSPVTRLGGAVFVAALLALAVLPGNRTRGAEPVECWRGWGYLSDPETRTYTSGELLLVTRGAADWRAGLPVELDRIVSKAMTKPVSGYGERPGSGSNADGPEASC